MKKPHSIFILGLLLSSAYTALFSQDILLTQGSKMKSIARGSFIQVEIPKPDNAICRRCPLNTITGQLISNDSVGLAIRIVESNQYMVSQSEHVGYEFKKYSDGKGPVMTIPKKEILSLMVKGKNKFRPVHPGDVVSESLKGLALGTLFFSSLDDHRSEWIFPACAVALLSAGILDLASYQPFYKMSMQSGLKKGTYKVWTLN